MSGKRGGRKRGVSGLERCRIREVTVLERCPDKTGGRIIEVSGL